MTDDQRLLALCETIARRAKLLRKDYGQSRIDQLADIERLADKVSYLAVTMGGATVLRLSRAVADERKDQ